MNAKEDMYFEELTKHREELAKALNDPALRGVKYSVVEKYSDQAHFIYELLQNADDAEATYCRFVLYKDKLVFAHNGARHFGISNPATEEEDGESGRLGDINGITSIANSSKSNSQNKIGKFGVGFKAVFQYTSTPYIYGPNVFFKIDSFIVPRRLNEDFPGRKEDETLFVFPFNHEGRTKEEAYEDISDKLRSLDYPVLFLSFLKKISFEIAGKSGFYNKSVIKNLLFDNTSAERICLTKDDGDTVHYDNLWMFSRKDSNKYEYSVAFFLNKEEKLISKQHSAFCFFPTKETTNLNFIIQAPFLLTDSREGIRAGMQHNKDMIQLLACLASDSLIYLRDIGIESNKQLIDDTILEIIPYNKNQFSDIDNKNRISFKPFYIEILNVMKNEEILPSSDGFVSKNDAHWANVPYIAKLFSNEQIAMLSGNKNAKWVFRSLGRQSILSKNKELVEYINSIIHVWIDEKDIINGWSFENDSTVIGGLKSDFIEAQSIEWLHLFYKWISESNSRIDLAELKPIFLNQDKKAVAAFDSKRQSILFISQDNENDYETVYPELLKNKETADFIKKLGITAPSLKDEIYNKILPKYNDSNAINTKPHFKKFFTYYNQCSQSEARLFINMIKKYAFVLYKSDNDEQQYRGVAEWLYLPNDKLKKWFKSKPDTKFVSLDEYLELVGMDNKDELINFLIDLGVKDEPRVLERELSNQEVQGLNQYWHRSTQGTSWTEKNIDGSKELIERLVKEKDAELSVLLWNQLLKYIESGYYYFREILYGSYHYFYRSNQVSSFESSEYRRLCTEKWLVDNEGNFVSADQLTIETLSCEYTIDKNSAEDLLKYLSIEHKAEDIPDYNLTDEQKEKIALAEFLEDIPLDELKRFAAQYRANKKSANALNKEEYDNEISEDSSVARISKEIAKRAISVPKIHNEKAVSEDDEEKNDYFDEDDYTKTSVDFSKKIERAKQKSANEIAEIAHLDELTQKALHSAKYSFGWFKSLLSLEALNSGENTSNSREVSISFSKVEREEGTSRTLILKHPDKYIPQSMEDLTDIPLQLHFKDHPMIRAVIEVVNVKSYTLRVKLRSNEPIDGVDLSLVTEANIVAKNPVFLLNELQKEFNKLDFNDDYNMKNNLCNNIEFVFGPPGTGKTTYLVKNVIIPIVEGAEEVKVLVLTPTNKASDVLIRRIMDVMGENKSYSDWLLRFGATNDTIIEQNGIFREKTFDIRNLSKSVTVTTIARFPYDYFMPDSASRLHLSEVNWDYIIIDEASMIPLVNIIFLLYKKTPKKFIIAGDPFQIEPITTVNMWKNENIYTLTELKSFNNPITKPHQYKVNVLTTQYRSVPEIGEVFSRLAYDGMLKHNRTSDSRRPLFIDEFINVKPLNIIKFPVSKYESIYRSKRLNNKSNYQVYSALFTFEFINYISSLLVKKNESEVFRIGLIAPYRAEADLIDKLITSADIPKNIKIQVGTIHGFQGDECDIIIAVFNTPPSISNSNEMFLNKLNIINVSISRARDYLFIIMPDDDTENIENLTLINYVEKLCKDKNEYTECNSKDIEEKIFRSRNYIENNSFSTSHQLVNVYGKLEKKYEIRSEDNAIDIQIHEV